MFSRTTDNETPNAILGESRVGFVRVNPSFMSVSMYILYIYIYLVKYVYLCDALCR